MPVALRVLGESNDVTLRMRLVCARLLYLDDGATLDDLREAVTMIEETERTARHVLGGSHPITNFFERTLREAQGALGARKTPSSASR